MKLKANSGDAEAVSEAALMDGSKMVKSADALLGMFCSLHMCQYAIFWYPLNLNKLFLQSLLE